MRLFLRIYQLAGFLIGFVAVFFLSMGIAAAADATGMVNLVWNANAETDVAGYTVQYGTVSGSYQTQSNSVSPAATLTGLTPGATYYCAVKAYNTSGLSSPLSQEISFVVPPPAAPEIVLENSDGNSFSDGLSALDLGEVLVQASGTTRNVTIKNTGKATLTGLGITLDGQDPANFSISSPLPLATLVTTNGSFESAFGSWTQTGNVRCIASTAATDGSNLVEFGSINTVPNGVLSQSFATIPGTTYSLTFDAGVLAYNTNQQSLLAIVTGSGSLLSKTITLTGVSDGSTRWSAQSFSFIANSSVTTLSFADVSTNTTNIDLRLDNIRVLSQSSSQGITSLEAGASATFGVTFSPAVSGAKSASLHISSNDADENPFDLALSGTAIGLAEISIRQSGGSELVSGSSTINFTNPNIGINSAAVTLVIQNLGESTLTGLAIIQDGPQSSDFIIENPETETLAPGESANVLMFFKPASTGIRNAVLHVVSSDEDESRFDIKLVGNGIATPDISIQQADGDYLTNGSSAVGLGSVRIGFSGVPETFIIRNLGTANLTNLALVTDGAHSSDFLVDPLGTTTLTPGSSATFKATFKPVAAGERTATIHVISNDASQNPFNITLTGTGTAVPEIAIYQNDESNLIDGTAVAGFGSPVIGTSSAAQSFTIRNTGTASLTGIVLASDGTHASDFTASSLATTSLAPGASTSFTIVFKPSSAGTRTAAIHVSSNDEDENPFDIGLTGTGTAVPEIAIYQNDESNLIDGSAVTAFGSLTLGAATATQSFTIRNTGTASLTGLAITRDGTHASDFTASVLGATSLAPGASTSFTIVFKPAAAGTRAAAVHVSSNDADENPFDISLTGIGIAVPEIAIEQSDGANLANGSATITFANTALGSSSNAQTITIRNTGTANLTNLAITTDGAHSSDYKVDSLAVTSLVPGAFATFQVQFKPTSAGTRTAAIHITSNDADESPYHIALTGEAIPLPEIAVSRADKSELIDGSSTLNAGSVLLGPNSISETLTIRNTGTANLTGLALTILGTNPADFTTGSLSTTTLAPGASTTFSLIFKPTAAGLRSAVIQIANNDADESPFDFKLSGTGTTAPEIAIEQSDGTTLASGSSTVSFGSANLGTTGTTQTLTIRNSGTAELTNLALTIDGSHSGDFLANGLSGSTLAPGATTTFQVTFKPSAAGARNAAIHVTSNDADENPYNISLTGNGIPVPEIAVNRADNSELIDGSSTLHIGSIILGPGGISETITIRNTGTANLTGLSLAILGTNLADFTASALTTTSLAPGANTTFTLTFKPAGAGLRSAFIQIANNDADESPFDFKLSGIGGTAPEIVVEQQNGTTLVSGSSAVGFDSSNLGTTGTSQVLTIRNSGTADLTNLALTTDGPHSGDFMVNGLSVNSLAPGASTTFQITFKPSVPGIRAAVIRIASNDVDENPYHIALAGFGIPVPEIAIQRADSSELADSGSTLELGAVNFGTTGLARAVTIRNTGTANLTGLAITTDGANPSDFRIGTLGATTLAPGGSTTFSITFIPSAEGMRSAAIHVASNDEDENPFDIKLEGIGGAVPEIAVEQQPGTTLVSGSAVVNYGETILGSPTAARTFTIRNLGTANLTNLAVTTDGANSSEFGASLLSVNSLAPGASTTFQVRFKPTAVGARNAAIHIASNDADEKIYHIALTGTGVAMPEIVVSRGDDSELEDNSGTLDLGQVNIGTTGTTQTITVRNTGTANLTYLSTTTDGDHAADFKIGTLRTTILAPGTSTTISVTFLPVADGTRSAALHIASNDKDEKIFDIQLTGIGNAVPEIALSHAVRGNLSNSSELVSFGREDIAHAGDAQSFTIRNLGSAPLSGLSLTITGANAADFGTSALSKTSLAPGASTTFKVSYTPSATGSRTATLLLTSNDEDEGKFKVNLGGTGVATPEISVTLKGSPEPANEISLLNFGKLTVATDKSKTIIITNRGKAPLTGLAITKDGFHASEFTVSALTKKSLAPGASTTFIVTFKPKSPGSRWAALHIASNDADESPRNIALTGDGQYETASTLSKKSALVGPNIDPPATIKGFTVINGQKYRTLTITWPEGQRDTTRKVEVSSNLLDWFSGKNHTTVLLDNANTLKVRDNTPITAGQKRYIRLERD